MRMNPRRRLLLLVLLPILLGNLFTSGVIFHTASKQVDQGLAAFGNAIADQLAILVRDPLVQADLLSLSVILNDLREKGNFSLVSVYGTDNRLLAQSGKSDRGLVIFTRDVVFQNSTVGYIQLGLPQGGYLNFAFAIALLAQFSVLVGLGLLLWLYGDLVYLWLFPAGKEVTAALAVAEAPADDSALGKQLTILVIKVRPLRQLEAYRGKILLALQLYRGRVEESAGDDFVVTFATGDQLFQAVCCGMLVGTIMKQARGKVAVKCGIHSTVAETGSPEHEKTRKHATYLASISEDRMLMSRVVYGNAVGNDQLTVQAYHSSLTPDGEVYYVERASQLTEELIERQAKQLGNI
jgi:hypothetical protein